MWWTTVATRLRAALDPAVGGLYLCAIRVTAVVDAAVESIGSAAEFQNAGRLFRPKPFFATLSPIPRRVAERVQAITTVTKFAYDFVETYQPTSVQKPER
jgi:hypothetical protein